MPGAAQFSIAHPIGICGIDGASITSSHKSHSSVVVSIFLKCTSLHSFDTHPFALGQSESR